MKPDSTTLIQQKIVSFLLTRSTRRVFEELIVSAKKSIWVSTYVFFNGHRAFELIAGRMDAVENLKVTLLLNIQRKHQETAPAEQLVKRFSDRFWKYDWPGRKKPCVYFDPRALELNGPSGVLHAKAVVIDDEAVFITSANLTDAAFDRNIEMGLLVRDRTLALTTSGHFQGLIDQGLLVLLPKTD